MNAHVAQLIAEEKTNQTGKLSLSGFALAEIPTELGEMLWLKELYLPRNNIRVIKKLEQLSNLEVLDLSFNQVSEIRLEGAIPRLKNLNLETNELGIIKDLESFPELQTLNIGGNKIEEIKNLEPASKLKGLDLAGNLIRDIKNLQFLFDLEYLSLSNNQIFEIKNLQGCPRLKKLYLTANLIAEIKNLESLTGLQSLSLRSNQIKEIQNLEALKGLEKLDLRSNKITEIKNLEILHGLKKLYLSNNRITEIKNLENLTELQNLRMEGNPFEKINNIGALISYPMLQELRLYGIKNNNLFIPPEYFGINAQSNALPLLQSYFESIKSGAAFTKEVPVILVGNSTTGKTSLRYFLKEKVFPMPKDYSTHGIEPDIWEPTKEQWPVPITNSGFTDAQIYFWDFGGQEYYHATHRLFFSPEAIYVLLWDKETNYQGVKTIPVKIKQQDGTITEEQLPVELFPYQYWLNSIRFYASWEEGAPILVVQNKVDDKSMDDDEPDSNDRKRYGIKKVFNLNVQTAAQKPGGSAYREAEHFLEYLFTLANRHAQRLARATYFHAIRSRMQALKSEHCWTREEFLTQLQLIDPNINEMGLLSYTADLHGRFMFHFEDDAYLRNFVFIDTGWVTECIYLILDRSVLENGGEFSEQHVVQRTGPKYARAFIELMKRFELIFENKETGDLIAPQYLPAQLSDRKTGIGKWNRLKKRFNDFASPNFYVRFPQFLPPAVMLQLLTRYGSEAIDQTYWKTGIAFLMEGKEVLVLLDVADRRFSLFVEDSDLYVQRLLFDALYQSTTEGNTLNLSLDHKDYINYNELRTYAANKSNKEVKAVNGSMVPLDGLRHFTEDREILKKKQAMNASKKEVKVFISYAHEDEKIKAQLVDTYLKAIQLHLDLNVTIWTDKDIKPGSNWNQAITAQLENADIVLFLISSSFIASKYIKETEIKKAVDRFTKGLQIIVPIYIEKVTKELLPFREKQFLPGNIPLKKWKDRNDAWVTIQGGLIEVFKDVKQGNIAAYFASTI